jgi:hypothetical protein
LSGSRFFKPPALPEVMTAFEEVEKLHILDPELFAKLSKGRIHEEGQ